MVTLRQRNKKWQEQVKKNCITISQTFTHKIDALQWTREKEIELKQKTIIFNFFISRRLSKIKI